MDSPKPGQCRFYANVLAISRNMWASRKGIWDKIKAQMVLTFEVSPCVIYWTFEFQFPLGHSAFLQENFPHVSGTAFWSSWKNERRISDILVCPHTRKHGKEFPKRLSVSAFPPKERYQCGQVELVQLGRGAEGPSLAPSPWHSSAPSPSPWDLPGEVTTVGLQSTRWKVSRSCPGEEPAGWRGAGEKVVTAKVAQERTKARIGAAAARRGRVRQPAGSWGKRGGPPSQKGRFFV